MSISMEYQKRIADLVEDNSVTDVTILAQAIGIDYARNLSAIINSAIYKASLLSVLVLRKLLAFFALATDKGFKYIILQPLCSKKESNATE